MGCQPLVGKLVVGYREDLLFQMLGLVARQPAKGCASPVDAGKCNNDCSKKGANYKCCKGDCVDILGTNVQHCGK
jgi:hypothetical protein